MDAFESEDHLSLLISSSPGVDSNKFNVLKGEYDALIEKLGKKRAKIENDKLFLKRLFYFVQSKQLHWYKDYVSFAEMLEKSYYDCMTGTALLAILLDEFKIPYQIIEFQYHTCLVATVSDQQIMLESTDPYEGFVEDAIEIGERMAHYENPQDKEPVSGISSNSMEYKLDFSNSQVINLQKLVGLSYFNYAANYYNQRNIPEAALAIEKAEWLYPSERILDMKMLIGSKKSANHLSLLDY